MDGLSAYVYVPAAAESVTKGGEPPMSLIPALISFLHLDSDEEGQGLAEYALILALIAIVAIVALIFLGGQVSSILSTVGKSV
jgi:pilus assembly protein Flp/PilA